MINQDSIMLTISHFKTLVVFFASATFAFAQTPSAVIVLDASGSMWGQIEGKAKAEIARDVIADLLADIPTDLELGLVAYGHRREGDCDDIELLIPPAKVDRAKFQAVVAGILPKGKTPLTAAVEFAAEALSYRDRKASIILITDGLENCDRDPCALAQQLKKNGLDFTAHVVAFDLTAKDALTVECIAKETGGQFLPAGDAASLATALHMAVNDIVTPTEEAKPEVIQEDPVILTVPKTVPAGSKFQVTFQFEGEGTGHPTDFITIVPLETEERIWENFAYTKNGSPVKLTALAQPQKAEIRYLSGQTRKTLGRLAIELGEVVAKVSSPAEATAASKVNITWEGPAYSGDFITIVPKDAAEGTWIQYVYPKAGDTTALVTAPPTAGPCEVRYVLGQGRATLARCDIMLTEGEATLSAPKSVTAGATVSIEWTGPMTPRDFITIVPKNTPEGKWAKYVYAKDSTQPAAVLAPMTPGPAEIRYVLGQGYKTLVRADIEITAAAVTLSAPDSAVAGSKISIKWTGPNHAKDFITIVSKGTPETKWAKYAYTKSGSPLQVIVPDEAGDAEIRYCAGQGYTTLARIPLKITPSTEE